MFLRFVASNNIYLTRMNVPAEYSTTVPIVRSDRTRIGALSTSRDGRRNVPEKHASEVQAILCIKRGKLASFSSAFANPICFQQRKRTCCEHDILAVSQTLRRTRMVHWHERHQTQVAPMRNRHRNVDARQSSRLVYAECVS